MCYPLDNKIHENYEERFVNFGAKIFDIRVHRKASYREMQNSLAVHQSVSHHWTLQYIIPSFFFCFLDRAFS